MDSFDSLFERMKKKCLWHNTWQHDEIWLFIHYGVWEGGKIFDLGRIPLGKFQENSSSSNSERGNCGFMKF